MLCVCVWCECGWRVVAIDAFPSGLVTATPPTPLRRKAGAGRARVPSLRSPYGRPLASPPPKSPTSGPVHFAFLLFVLVLVICAPPRGCGLLMTPGKNPAWFSHVARAHRW
eukprot:scaffold26152_cov126-Isochrysis_galbana.AAC.1